MSWALGYDSNWKRDIGYGVPCVCDHPDCKEKIDRGLSYVCGGEPYGGDKGCGLYFCEKHRSYACHPECDAEDDDNWVSLCERCAAAQTAFDAKPDVRRWINWKLTDASWAKWRKENPEFVAQHTRPARERTRKPKRQRNPYEQEKPISEGRRK